MPLVIGGICLGWYNRARFGSITETGVFYSLGGPYIQKYSNELFSPIYIFQNLYNYLLVPFELRAEFPFIEPTRGSLTAIFPFYILPQIYFTNLITGLLCTMPFIVFSLTPPAQFISRFFKRDSTDRSPDQELFRWIIVCLTGCWLAAFVALLGFFWAAMRYMQDFMPALMILSVIGFWQGYKALAPGSIARKRWVAFGIVLTVASITITMLLAISAHLIYLK